MSEIKTSSKPSRQKPPAEITARKILRIATGFFAAERLWFLLWPPVALALALLGLHLLGLFSQTSAWITIPAAAIAVAAVSRLLWKQRHPLNGLRKHVRRLYEGEERPLSSLEDRIAIAASSKNNHPKKLETQNALWERHRLHNEKLLRQREMPLPRFALSEHDPYALRGLAIIIFTLGIVIGDGRLSASQQAGADDQNARFNLWLDPPGYTGLAPLALPDEGSVTAIEIAEGSRLTGLVQQNDGAAPRLALDGKPLVLSESEEGGFSVEHILDVSARLTLKIAGAERGWPLIVVPDAPPEVALAFPIIETTRGALQVAYEASDDYGVRQIDLVVERVVTVSEAGEVSAEVLAEAGATDEDGVLRVQLYHSERGVRRVADENYPDLRAHPWAGLEVEAFLEARDAAGQTATSERQSMTLPEIRFTHPLARLLIELRKRLAAGPDAAPEVRARLDAALSEWRAEIDSANNLALDYVLARLLPAAGAEEVGQDEITESQGLLWAVARNLEEGEIDTLADELRALLEEIRKAIAEGRSQEEIEALLEELRVKSLAYLQQLRDQAAARGERNRRGRQGQGSPLDIDDLFEEAQDSLESGARSDLLSLLDQLERALENPQFGEGEGEGEGQGFGEGEGEGEGGGGSLSQEIHLFDEQARILDETFRARQQGDAAGVGGELSRDQDALREELRGYVEGQEMSEGARQLLERAGERMEEAARLLESGSFEGAEEREREALQDLRLGIRQHITERLSGGEGGSGGPVEGRRGGLRGLHDEHDLSGEARSRSREILEQIRPRLQRSTSEEERRYLEDLIRRF
ncbi:MAG: DUF4175 domain-containing protein [Alphaproteobacteria bacterium]|nr:DUF4175 domain-containing protein [Alphaproteobacteria bacterium]